MHTSSPSPDPLQPGKQFAREQWIDLNEKLIRTVADESEATSRLSEWQSEMPVVASAYEPSGALPARAVILLLFGSVTGSVAGLFAGTVVGSAGLGLSSAILHEQDILSVVKLIVIPIYFFTILGSYFVTGWLSAWCTTLLGELGKNRNVPAAALFSGVAAMIPLVFAYVCYDYSHFFTDTDQVSSLEKLVRGESPFLAIWLFSNPLFPVGAVFGVLIAPSTAMYFAAKRVQCVKFCEPCNSFMRASGPKELSLGCLRALVRAFRKGRPDVAGSLLLAPSWGDGEARLYYCRSCSHGYLEVIVRYFAKWEGKGVSVSPFVAKKPTVTTQAWLAVSSELAAPDVERCREALLHAVT